MAERPSGRKKGRLLNRPTGDAPAPVTAPSSENGEDEEEEAGNNGNAAATGNQIEAFDYNTIHDLPPGPTPLAVSMPQHLEEDWTAHRLRVLQFNQAQIPEYDLQHANLDEWHAFDTYIPPFEDETFPNTDANQVNCVHLILRALWSDHGKLDVSLKNLQTHLEKIGMAGPEDTNRDANYRADKARVAVHTAWWLLDKCCKAYVWFWRGHKIPTRNTDPTGNTHPTGKKDPTKKGQQERPARFITFAYYFTAVLDIISRHNQVFDKVMDVMQIPPIVANPWGAESSALTDIPNNMSKKTAETEAHARYLRQHPNALPRPNDFKGWKARRQLPPLPDQAAPHDAHVVYHIMRWVVRETQPPPAGLFTTRLVAPLAKRYYGQEEVGPLPALLVSDRGRKKLVPDTNKPDLEAELVTAGAFGSTQPITLITDPPSTAPAPDSDTPTAPEPASQPLPWDLVPNLSVLISHQEWTIINFLRERSHCRPRLLEVIYSVTGVGPPDENPFLQAESDDERVRLALTQTLGLPNAVPQSTEPQSSEGQTAQAAGGQTAQAAEGQTAQAAGGQTAQAAGGAPAKSPGHKRNRSSQESNTIASGSGTYGSNKKSKTTDKTSVDPNIDPNLDSTTGSDNLPGIPSPKASCGYVYKDPNLLTLIDRSRQSTPARSHRTRSSNESNELSPGL